MEEIVDDDFDDQNTADGSNLDQSGDVDQANMRDDAVGCFKSHTGTMQLKIFRTTANLKSPNGVPYKLICLCFSRCGNKTIIYGSVDFPCLSSVLGI